MEKEKHTKRNILLIILLFLILFFLWAKYINTKGLKIYEYGIVDNDLPESFHGLKIVQISDIHYGNTTLLDDIKNIVKNVNELNPDVVIFTGDLYDEGIKISNKELDSIKKELKKINTTLYKYAILGDADISNIDTYKELMHEADFNCLDNSNDLLYYKGNNPIKIVGITNTNELDNAFLNEVGNPFTIALLHKPDLIDNLSEYKIDIAFAGHSLGGQIRIPFMGGIIKKDGAKKYLDRHYKLNDTELYISSGIGTEKVKLRTFNKPSISLYRIYNH